MKAIEYLVEYSVSNAELDKIPADQKAVLAVISYAVTEINSLRKLYLASDHSAQGVEAIDSMISHQRNMLLRLWSAKLFEFSDFIKLETVKPKIMDQAVLDFGAEMSKQFASFGAGSGYEAARNLRHEATNHYSFPAAKKNLEHLDTTELFKMYLHDLNGNAHYPWGDLVMFFARFRRHEATLSAGAARSTLVEDWINWNLRATEWLDHTASEAFKQFILDRFPEKFARRRDYWIDPILVANTSERRMPIILRKTTP